MAPITPLFRPREYFEDNPRAFNGGMGVFTLYIGVLIFGLLLGKDTAIFSLVGLFTIASLVISLLGIAYVMHKLVGGDDTAGSYRDAAGIAGWAFAPDVLVVLGHVLLTAWLYGSAIDYVDALNGSASTTGIVFSIVGVGWSVYIMAQGLRGTHDVGVKTALTPALVIGSISLILSLNI